MSNTQATDLAKLYYEDLANRGDFSSVPMADDLKFASPMMQLDSAAAFRGALGGLVQRVAGLAIRHQVQSGNAVVTVYDLDMGLPSGPVPMAEVLTAEGGAIAHVELLFDPSVMAPPAG